MRPIALTKDFAGMTAFDYAEKTGDASIAKTLDRIIGGFHVKKPNWLFAEMESKRFENKYQFHTKKKFIVGEYRKEA